MLPESEVIMEYLEERYPEPALWPADPAERALGAALAATASTTGSAATTTPRGAATRAARSSTSGWPSSNARSRHSRT